MSLTIVIVDDAHDYRSLVRFLLTKASETMTIVAVLQRRRVNEAH